MPLRSLLSSCLSLPLLSAERLTPRALVCSPQVTESGLPFMFLEGSSQKNAPDSGVFYQMNVYVMRDTQCHH